MEYGYVNIHLLDQADFRLFGEEIAVSAASTPSIARKGKAVMRFRRYEDVSGELAYNFCGWKKLVDLPFTLAETQAVLAKAGKSYEIETCDMSGTCLPCGCIVNAWTWGHHEHDYPGGTYPCMTCGKYRSMSSPGRDHLCNEHRGIEEDFDDQFVTGDEQQPDDGQQ